MSFRVNDGFIVVWVAAGAASLVAIHLLSTREKPSQVSTPEVVIVTAAAGTPGVAAMPAKKKGNLSALSTNIEDFDNLDELRVALANGDANTRLDAVSALGILEDLQAEDLLGDVASHDANPSVRAEALHALGDRGAGVLNPALASALNDPDAGIRRAAIHALEIDRSQMSLPFLAQTLQDADASVRATAADAIAEIGGAEARRLLESVRGDENAGVREVAAEHLTNVR